jgi:RNA polymerase sigma-70 factor (ECF subfamily)
MPADGLDVEMLYRKYGHSVRRRARQILASEADARDVVQEVFAGLLARPSQFAQRGSPAAFLYAITTHACLARLRDTRNQLRLIDEHVRPWASDLDPRSPEAHTLVQSALAQLPTDEAEAAVYYYLDGMSHAEIADVLECSPRHVGNLLARIAARFQARKEAS